MGEPLSILIGRTDAGLYRATLPDHGEIVVEADDLGRLLAMLAPKIDPIIPQSSGPGEPSGADETGGDDGFANDLAYVLDKNAELYRRLAL